MFTIMTNGTRERHGRVNYTLTAVRRVTHRRRRPIALRPGLVVRKGRSCSYFKRFRRSLLQNPGRHLRGGYDDSGLVVSMPPRVVVVEARIGRHNAFATVVARRAESSSFFGAPRHASKTTRTFLKPPHPMVRAPRPDRAVHTTALRLPRLEGPRRTEREVRISTCWAIGPRRTGLGSVQ